MKDLGFTDDDLAVEVDIFPENWPALLVFMALTTQWRCDAGGNRSGLHYEALPLVMAVHGVKKKQQADVFNAVQTMEQAALSVWREAAK